MLTVSGASGVDIDGSLGKVVIDHVDEDGPAEDAVLFQKGVDIVEAVSNLLHLLLTEVVFPSSLIAAIVWSVLEADCASGSRQKALLLLFISVVPGRTTTTSDVAVSDDLINLTKALVDELNGQLNGLSLCGVVTEP